MTDIEYGADDRVDFERADEPESDALFDGDTGVFSVHVRAALVRISRGPYLDGYRHPEAWSALVKHEAAARQFFSELFMKLTIDQSIKVAFHQQADTPDGIPTIMPKKPMTLVDTMVLLFLRQTLIVDGGYEQRVFVSLQEIRDHVLALHTTERTSEASVRRSIDRATKNMSELPIIRPTPDDPGRFLVLPVVRHIVSHEQMTAMMASMAALAASDTRPDEDHDEDDDA